MNQDWLTARLQACGDAEAIAGEGWSTTYADLLSESARWMEDLKAAGVGTGRVVAFDGDFRDRTVALLLALRTLGAIAVPLASATVGQRAEFLEIAQAEFLVAGLDRDHGELVRWEDRPGHPLLESLAREDRPGLVLFSSGSTGRPKAMVHDLDLLLEKFVAHRPPLRVLSFLLLDHIGGLNTLFAGLAQGGTVITVRERRPEPVCQAIARHRAEVLPTTPTFLNLLLLSGEHRRHDLSSLKVITYGTEPMPASTLERLRTEFPETKLQQTYGLSEVGILRSKSREDGSLWVKVGGEGYETKIIDGVLWIRAQSAMIGYLNAESPFDADGWFNTRDVVEQDGEWLRFLGRDTELINVGGQKVYPAEVESMILKMDGVIDVTVRGEPNPLLGHCIVARVNLDAPESIATFKTRMRRHCQGRLAPYMVPVKVEIADSEQHGARYKRLRNSLPSADLPQ